MQRLAHSLLLLCLALAGCRRHELVPGVSDSLFVATMADLRRLQVPVGDSAVLAAKRRQVLQQRGLTAEQLESAGRALGTDPERAVAIFQAIDRRAVNATDSTR